MERMMSVGMFDVSAGFGLGATEAGGDDRKTLRRGQLLQERKVVVDVRTGNTNWYVRCPGLARDPAGCMRWR